MPGFYSKYLGPKLADRVAEITAATHAEQLSLYQELAIVRAAACEALALSQPLFDPTQVETLKPETKALMVQTLQQAMDNVKDMVLAASKIEKDSDDKVSMKVVNLVVQQIIVAINEECGTTHMSLAEAIAKRIDDSVRLPLNDAHNPIVKINLVEDTTL